MRLGNKDIFHLEAFVAKFMAIYKRWVALLCSPFFSELFAICCFSCSYFVRFRHTLALAPCLARALKLAPPASLAKNLPAHARKPHDVSLLPGRGDFWITLWLLYWISMDRQLT
jgi:hypothetical protein